MITLCNERIVSVGWVHNFYEQGERVADGFDFWSNFIWIFPHPKNNRREEKKSSYRFYALALFE